MARIVIKIGSNVITENKRLNLPVVQSIVDQIAELYQQGHEVVLVSSGAIVAGMEVADLLTEKDKVLRKQMLAAIGQARLMHVYQSLFQKHHILIGQALLEREHFSSRHQYLNLRNTLEGLLRQRIIPIINENDVVASEEIRFSDNDQLSALVASSLRADMLIICTDIDGFYTGDPRKNKQAKLLKEIENVSADLFKMAGKSSSGVGLGGMLSKLGSAKIAAEQGVEIFICNGRQPDAILNVLAGKNPGTHIHALKKDARQIKSWATTAAISKGILMVNAGVAEALHKRKSLLLVGINQIKGNFDAKEPVTIRDLDGKDIAIGMSNFSSVDLEKALKSTDKKQGKEIIHADKLFLYET